MANLPEILQLHSESKNERLVSSHQLREDKIMLEAITYGSMLENIKEHKISADTIGILLTRPTSRAGKDIVETLPYYHHRSGRSINFYLPGYGAYWYGVYPDEKDVAIIDSTQWSFSNQKYVEFIEALEKHSKWKYSGESELLLIEYANDKLDYSRVLRFHLDAMMRDGAIPSVNVLFENLFRYASRQRTLTEISDITSLKTLGQITMDCILAGLPELFSGVIKKGRHYLVNDYVIY